MVGLLSPEPYRPYILNTGLFALSGGITNLLAIHMLFEPVPGLYGSGVIQLRFEEFKVGIRNLIMGQFFDQADLKEFFADMASDSDQFKDQIRKSVDALDLDSAFESLLDVIMMSSFSSMLGMIGGRDALKALREPFVDKMKAYFQANFSDDKLSERMQASLSSALDESAIRKKLEQLIDDRLDEMTPNMVKLIVQDMIRRHLGWLVVWGCAFGGLIGLIVTLLT